MAFKVGDRVRYIDDGDEGTITAVEGAWVYVDFEEDGDTSVLEEDIELISGNSEEATRNRAKGFAIIDEATISDEMYEAVKNATRINGVDLSPESKRANFELNVRRITDQIADLLIAKNKQYSNSALDPIRVFSKADRMEQLRVRADDKLSRIRNGDTSEDAVLDLCGYLILMKIAGESE
jgi:hypothetical protein